MRFSSNLVATVPGAKNKVKPLLLYFAVEDGLLDESVFEQFISAWERNGLPILGYSGDVKDVNVLEMLQIEKEDPSIFKRLNLEDSKTDIIDAANKLVHRMGLYE